MLQNELNDESGNRGSVWVTRMDWWGWCDMWNPLTEKLTQDWNHDGAIHTSFANRDNAWTTAEGKDVNGTQFETAMSNSDIVWKCVREGKVVTNFFTIYSQSGEVFTFWTKATDIDELKTLRLHMASEFAKYIIYSVNVE